MRKTFLILCLAATAWSSFSQSPKGAAARGVDLYMNNKPLEASVFFEQALKEDPSNEKLYDYLGICYQQLGRHDDAIAVMKRGLTVTGARKEILYYNIANNFAIERKYSFAEEMYSNAIDVNRAFAPAYLNRGQTRYFLQKYADTISDYTIYLSLEPATPQKGNILSQIAALRGILDEEERVRKAKLEEEQRLVAEKERVRLEQEAREKALLNEVLNSLKTASEGTKNVSAGSEGLQEYDDEMTIED